MCNGCLQNQDVVASLTRSFILHTFYREMRLMNSVKIGGIHTKVSCHTVWFLSECSGCNVEGVFLIWKYNYQVTAFERLKEDEQGPVKEYIFI